jgi:hypothetical protein
LKNRRQVSGRFRSRRYIRLTPRAIEALEAHLERELREIGILGDRYKDQGLLFTTSTGDQPFQPAPKGLCSPPEGGKTSAHQLPQPPSHLRHPVAHTGHPSEARPGASRTRYHCHDPRHLLALPAEHGGTDREGDGGRAFLEQNRVAAPLLHRCCTKALDTLQGLIVNLRFTCKSRTF